MGLFHERQRQLLVVAILSLTQPTATLYNCDSYCQQRQGLALLAFHNSTGGSDWHLNSTGFVAPENLWGNDNAGTSSLPAHCSWAGVGCCGSNGYLYFPGLDPNFAAAYNQFQCSTPGGVVLLFLTRVGLTGILPQSAPTWAPLARTLQYLDLTGALDIPQAFRPQVRTSALLPSRRCSTLLAAPACFA